MLIGQTHKVDLASPVDYQPNTIYKFGSVVKYNGNLYTANCFIPAVDPGPGKSTCWELVSEAPEINPDDFKATAPPGYVDAVKDLGWDNTGKTMIDRIPDNTNIYMPAGDYIFSRRVENTNGVNLLGSNPEYRAKFTSHTQFNGTNITIQYYLGLGSTTTKKVTVKNIHFTKNYVTPSGEGDNIIFDNCFFDGCWYDSGAHARTVFNFCSFISTGESKVLTASDQWKDDAPVLYNCCLLSSLHLSGTSPLGKNATWYNPILYATESEVGETDLINPTYIN